MTLSQSEIKTLSVIADPGCCDAMPRVHLEKLSRLDLIEPSATGLRLSNRGQQILFRHK